MPAVHLRLLTLPKYKLLRFATDEIRCAAQAEVRDLLSSSDNTEETADAEESDDRLTEPLIKNPLSARYCLVRTTGKRGKPTQLN